MIKRNGFATGVVVALVGVASAGIIAACGSSTSKANQPGLDSGNNGADMAPAITIVDPDGFSNISAKRVGKDGVYAAFHGDNTYAAVSVVPNDPNCVTGTYVDPNIK